MGMTLLPLALIAAAAWASGRSALFAFAWPDLRRYERLSLELVAGLGIVSLVITIALLTGWFASVTFALAGLCALAARTRRGEKGGTGRTGGMGVSGWIVLCAVVACLGAIPPVTDLDALSYVLPIARHISDARALGVWSDQARSMWPQGHQVLIAYIMSMGGDRFGALSALEWLLAVGSVSALARRVCTRAEHVPVALALAIGAPSAAFMVPTAKEDMILLAATAAAAFCLLGGTRRELIAGGFFAGIAAAMKYPGLGVALAVVMWAAICPPPREASGGLERRVASAALAAAGALVAGGVWYALNLWRFGNPVAPFVFGAPGTPLTADAVRTLMDSYGGGTGLLSFVVTPVRIFLEPSLYCGRAMLFNPLAYAGLAGLASARDRARSGGLCFIVLVLYGGWFLTLQNARLLLPAAALLAPLAADRLVPLAHRWRVPATVSTLALAIPVLLAPVVGIVRAGRYVAEPATFLARETQHHADIDWANAHLDPARHRIASIFGDVYHFTIPALGLEPTHQFAVGPDDLAHEDEQFLAACRRAGITHLFATPYNYTQLRSRLRVVHDNPASRRGGFHFFREPGTDPITIFEILP